MRAASRFRGDALDGRDEQYGVEADELQMITNMDAGIAVRGSPSHAKSSNPLRPTLVREALRSPPGSHTCAQMRPMTMAGTV